MDTGVCRWCGYRVLWVRMKSGKMMPVNPEFVNYKVDRSGKEKIVTPHGDVIAGNKCDSRDADGYGYISHFATCQKMKRSGGK